MFADLETLLDEARRDISAASATTLDQVKSAYLGKSGRLGVLLRQLGQLPIEQRAESGKKLNELRSQLEALLAQKKGHLKEQRLKESLQGERVDVTLPGRTAGAGSRHPLTLVMERSVQIFNSMGFEMADGPEIEDDFHNFEALNMPPDHPARSAHDTFYFGDGTLLRTHTSPVQIRYMQANPPPLRVIAPGRVYRVDNDATHSPMFHQIEGLWIDEQARFSDLKGLLLGFFRELFEDSSVDVRFRPSFFPFTEPSAEVDIRFGTQGWLEVAGCGMVHPNVLEASGIDSSSWQGFAFGTGIDRMAMLRYGIGDIRALYENDVRFLLQFA